MSENHAQTSRKELATYPAFFYSRWLGKSNRFLLRLQVLLAGLFAVTLLGAAYVDNTLYIPGEAVGFLEHPGAYIYIIAQAVLPFAILKGIHSVLSIPDSAATVFGSGIQSKVAEELIWFRKSLRRQTKLSRAAYVVISGFGFGAFVWNCYQNQLPFQLVGHDFWDSVLHPFGYWSTRVHKAYIAIVLAPGIVHVQFLIVVFVRRILLTAAEEGKLKIEPYHPDGCGGVRIFIDSVIGPMLPVLLFAALMSFSALFVHRQYDITTVGGLLLTCSLVLLIYFIPAVTLRKAIVVEKSRQLTHISRYQEELYSAFLLRAPQKIHDILENLKDLETVGQQVDELPNWPQLRKTVRVVSLAGSSPIFGWAAEQLWSWLIVYIRGNTPPI